MNLGKAMACTILAQCPSTPSPHHYTNAERWPMHPPATTRPDTVMVGDSIAAQWTPTPAAVLNHAIGGQTLAQVAEYYNEDLQDYHPRAAIIEGGVNDLRAKSSVDQVIQHRMSLLTRSLANGIKVYMVNIIPHDPAGACADPNSGWNLVTQESVATFNAFLANLCADHARCTLVDFAGKFGPTFNPALYYDCAHPNGAGHILMDEALTEALQ